MLEGWCWWEVNCHKYSLNVLWFGSWPNQGGFLQTDTAIKHALSEVCCAVPLLWTKHRRVAYRLSWLSFPISTHATTAPAFSFSVAHIALLFCSKQLGIHWWWNLSRCYTSLCVGRGVIHCCIATNEYLYLTALNTFTALKFLCADAGSQRLVFLQAAFDSDRAGPRKGSGRPSTYRDRKWSLVGACWWQLCLPYLKCFFIAAYFT